MEHDYDVEIVFRSPEGSVVVATYTRNVVTEGKSDAEAKEMLSEAVQLYHGEGEPVTDSDLEDFGLGPELLDTKPLPTDFEKYSGIDPGMSGKNLATVLLKHGFRPISRTKNHLKLYNEQQDDPITVTVPILGHELDPFVTGFISGHCGEPDDPSRFIEWAEEALSESSH